MAHDVFISYSRKNLDFVTQLHQYLINNGISAWFDKDNIKVADHWRTSIVEGVQDCKVFVLVLSPGSAASVNVRKEVDLAERYKKTIVPIMWQKTGIPVAMQYQLAGIQYIDFNETASDENLNQLANALRELIGGATLAQTANKVASVTEKPLVPVSKKLGGSVRIGRKSKVDPIAIGGLVIANVVTTLDLTEYGFAEIDEEDSDRKEEEIISEQDFVNNELDWLFEASDHLLQLRNGTLKPNEPIYGDESAIPVSAKKSPKANNKILNRAFPKAFAPQIEKTFGRIKKRLGNLNNALERETQLGGAALENPGLQSEIKGNRLEIAKELKGIAQLTERAYGVLVKAPDLLIERLEE